jgi:hypothetical protein
MRKLLLIAIFPFLSLLAACGSVVQTPTVADLPTRVPTSTGSPVSTCLEINLEPTPDSRVASLFPAVSDKDYVMGPPEAPMTIIEYGDFQ